jgi:superfamily II DNA or RNA helicase
MWRASGDNAMTLKTQHLISHQWVRAALPPITSPTEPVLRDSQNKVVRILKDAVCMILEAPTGWGKSLVMCVLTLSKLLRKPRLRCIIAVPQTTIGCNFDRDWQLPVPGQKQRVRWAVPYNLCKAYTINTVQQLLAFLSQRRVSSDDRVLVCTHATLAQAYRRLNRSKKLDLLKDALIWIDEGHHVMNAQVVNSRETVSNALGELVKHCATHGVHIGLATATYQRGDMRHIVPDALREAKFLEAHIDYEEYFQECAPVESFEFKVVCGDTLDALKSIFRRRVPTILYLAKRNSRYAERCKYKEVEKIVRQLSRLYGKPVQHVIDEETGARLIGIGSLRILDLVNEKGRATRKHYLDKSKVDKSKKVDIILALDTCKEGFDWDAASRCIILGERYSMPEKIQMIGRLFRRCPGKEQAEVYQVLPAAVPNCKEFKDRQNSILTVMFSAMLLEDVFLPISVTGPDAKKSRRGPRKKHSSDKLIDLFPNSDTFLAFQREFFIAVHDRNYEAAYRQCRSLLAKYGIPKERWKATWERLWRRFAYTVRRQKGLKLDVPFEVLKTMDLARGFLTLASGPCTSSLFTDFRAVLGRTTRTLDEWVLIAEELAIKNRAGVLEK